MMTLDDMKTNFLMSMLQWEKILMTALGLFAIFFVISLLRRVTDKAIRRWSKRRLRLYQIRTVSILLIYIMGFVSIIRGVWGLSHEGVLLFGATLAVALGFAFKDLTASVIAGLILIFDGPFQVGDRVRFQGAYGDIKMLGLRATRLLTLDDSVVTIPNHLFLNEATLTANDGALHMMAEVDFHVAPQADLGRAKRLVEEAIALTPYVDRRRAAVVMVKETSIGAIPAYQLKAKVYIEDFLKEKLFETALTLQVSELFQQHRIERPFIPGREQSPTKAGSSFKPPF